MFKIGKKKYKLNDKGKVIFYSLTTIVALILIYANLVMWGALLS